MGVGNIFRENWNYGKWITPSSLLVAFAGQAQVFVVGGLLGLEGAGILRISQNLMQPMGIIIFALGSLSLPMMSKDYGNQNLSSLKHKAFILTATVFSLAIVYALLFFVFRYPIERILYGGKYRDFVNIFAAWGLIPILMALYSGFSYALQAVQRPQAILIVSGIWAPISIISAIIFTRIWGIWGAT